MINEKVYISIIGICLFMFIVALTGFGIQSSRLGHYMAECERYRTEYQRAQDREREIGECISRTTEILSSTEYSVRSLKDKLKTVEDSYNYMWELLTNNDNTLSDRENKEE